MSYRTRTGKLYRGAVLGKLRFGAGTMTQPFWHKFSSVTERRTNGEIQTDRQAFRRWLRPCEHSNGQQHQSLWLSWVRVELGYFFICRPK